MDFICPILKNFINLTYCYNCPFYKEPYEHCSIFRLYTLRQSIIIQKDSYTSNNEHGYEFTYELIPFLKNAGLIMISTQEVLKTLKDQFNLEIDRTLLFKYEKKGLLEKGKRTSEGRGKGSKQNWNDETPLKVYYIDILKEKGLSLQDLKKYHDIINLKDPGKLFEYGIEFFKRGLGLINSKGIDDLEIMKFKAAVVCFAAVKAALEPPLYHKIGIIPGAEPGDSEIYIFFEKPHFKKVIFSKDGVKIKNISQEEIDFATGPD